MEDLSSRTRITKKPAVWLYQVFNLNSLIIFSFLTIIILAETRFNFLEKMIGNYIKWQNTERKKLGRIWNIEEQSVTARGQLNELLIKKEEKRKKIGKIESFRELFELLETDRLISLTKEQFVKIYNRLPLTISNKIIDPYDLINYFHRSGWVKAFVFQKETGFVIVMTDGKYGVLNSLLISEKDANYLAKFGKTVPASLENIEELSSRIYDVREFFDALYKMSQEERNKIIHNPFNILNWGSRLKRIGISEISEDNLVQIGFELHTLDKKEVLISFVDDFLISNLMQYLIEVEKPLPNFTKH